MSKHFFQKSLLIIGVLCLLVSWSISVSASGFPDDYFGNRYAPNPLNKAQSDCDGQGIFANWTYNGSFSGTPNNLSALLTISTGVGIHEYICMCIYDMNLDWVANTEYVDYTGYHAEQWQKFTVNATKNQSCLIVGNNYFLGLWCMPQLATIPYVRITYDNVGSQTCNYKNMPSYFSWSTYSNLGSFTGVEFVGTACMFCNYTENAEPFAPTNCSVAPLYSTNDSFLLVWDKGYMGDYTIIRYDICPLLNCGCDNVSNGTLCYNGTGTSTTVGNFNSSSGVSFCFWSWNSTRNMYSLTSCQDDDVTYCNPIAPTDFIGNNVSATRNLFAWVKGINSTTTLVRYNINTSYPSTPSSGTLTYNSTGSYDSDSGLVTNSTFYYSAWSFNSTSGLFSYNYTTLVISNILEGGSCCSANLVIYNNTVNVTGNFEQSYSCALGHKVWLNFTGIGGGGGCSGIVWVNYTDDNVTFNVSVDKSDDSNTSSYSINEDVWLYLSGLEFDTGLLGIMFVFALFSLAFIVDREHKDGTVWKPILLFIAVPVALATGIFYLGSDWFGVEWWIGLVMFLFSILLSFGGLYYAFEFGKQ